MNSEIRELIDNAPDGLTSYYSCPSCGGYKKSLGITKEGSSVKWGCFRASCNERGITNSIPSIAKLKERLAMQPRVADSFVMPDHFVLGIANDKCATMLHKYYCLDAYSKGVFKCAYDPREDRLVLFLEDTEGKIVGAVGRALSKSPMKVKNYFTDRPFIVSGTTDILLVVEDCFSAISATRFGFSGLALLGTNMKPNYIEYLKRYAEVIIALDADAKVKALKIKDYVKDYIPNVKVKFLKKDIKDSENNPFTVGI